MATNTKELDAEIRVKKNNRSHIRHDMRSVIKITLKDQRPTEGVGTRSKHILANFSLCFLIFSTA